jgi:hypothetical protein
MPYSQRNIRKTQNEDSAIIRAEEVLCSSEVLMSQEVKAVNKKEVGET